jgi:hypothetical protein
MEDREYIQSNTSSDQLALLVYKAPKPSKLIKPLKTKKKKDQKETGLIRKNEEEKLN